MRRGLVVGTLLGSLLAAPAAGQHRILSAHGVYQRLVATQWWNTIQLDDRSDCHGAGEYLIQWWPVGEHRAVRWLPASGGCPRFTRDAKRDRGWLHESAVPGDAPDQAGVLQR